MNQARGRRSRAPQKKSAGDHPVHVEAVHQPAGDDLEERIGPEEGGKQQPELRIGDLQLSFEQRRRNGKIAAVDVIDKDGKRKQDQHERERAREPGTNRH